MTRGDNHWNKRNFKNHETLYKQIWRQIWISRGNG